MRIYLNLAYKKLPTDVGSASALSDILITTAVGLKYPQGMPRTESRMYAKLLDQLYDKPEVVDIDESTFKLVKEALDTASLAPHMSSWRWTLLDYLEQLEKETAKKPAEE